MPFYTYNDMNLIYRVLTMAYDIELLNFFDLSMVGIEI